MPAPAAVTPEVTPVARGSDLTRAALKATAENYRAEIQRFGSITSTGSPGGHARMVGFLFFSDGAYVNGQTIPVDGGTSLN